MKESYNRPISEIFTDFMIAQDDTENCAIAYISDSKKNIYEVTIYTGGSYFTIIIKKGKGELILAYNDEVTKFTVSTKRLHGDDSSMVALMYTMLEDRAYENRHYNKNK